jgi:glutamate racemase
MLMSPNSPIAVLDSGLGGLTVVRALRAALPAEDVAYFGDTARLPYGSKTAATVTGYVRQIIAYLRPLAPKHVVIACNTATALALPTIRAEFPDLSVSGVIEPGSKAAVIAAGPKKVPVIGVLATDATIRSKAYERAIHRRRNLARLLLRSAPLLVPIIEEGRGGDDPLVRLALRQYLQPLIDRQMDVLVLGCTHYPILRDAIAATVGPTVRVIDSAEQCAQDVARRLATASALKGGLGAAGGAGRGWLRCFVTDDAPRFAALAARFLGEPIAEPRWVPPEVLYAGSEMPAVAPLRVPAA